MEAKWIYKMDLSILMIIFNNVKHGHAVHLKLGNTFFTSFTKLIFEAKTSIYSTIKKYIFLNYRILVAYRCHILKYFNTKVCFIKKCRS